MASGSDRSESESETSQTVSRRVISGEYILRKNKNVKGSRAWEQFRIVYNSLTDEEVFGVACCSVCKACIVYKKVVRGEERSLGTKNMLDHLRRCLPARARVNTSTSSEGESTCSSNHLASSKPGTSSSCTVSKRPCLNTLDSYVLRSGKKVGEGTRKVIREKTATLVAAAQLPYRFVEQDALKNFAQSFVELGASHGCVPASEFLVGRVTVRKDIVSKVTHIQATIKSALQPSALQGAASVVTDLWSDNVVSRSYLDVTFFWVEESGPDKRIWSLKHAMYACKFFPENKTADHIQVALDQILDDAGLDTEHTPCTTDKGSNMVAATKSKCHVNCACHRLSTSINTAWEASCAEIEELKELDDCSNSLVKFVKKSGGIQYNLPATLKSGGKTRPWRGLINKFRSISKSYEALKPLLREKRREDLVATVEKSLLDEVLHILEKAEEIFDILEYSFLPSLQFVLPAFYKLRNFWCEVSAADTAASRVLKRNLVVALDSKMWEDVTALHVASSYLDPSLKGFSFVRDAGERRNLSKQAEELVRHNAMIVAKMYVYPDSDELEDGDIEALEDDEEERQEVAKRTKHDPLAEFRNASTGSGSSKKKSSNMMAEVDEELRRYHSISDVNLKQAHAVRSIFDPLLWWGEQRYSFPVLSILAKQFLVLPASSAESERHFSAAGRIARKDRNRLKDDAVESCVVYYEAVRKGII